ncbi:MAG TPA: hypothetical protein VGM19_09875 [Armatimonadota bacterium]
MDREELWEWLGLIAAILVWWPALLGWFPLPYKLFVYAYCLVALTWITWRRVARMREALRYSREIMDCQRGMSPPALDKRGKR